MMQVIFYIFASLSVLSALLVVTQNNPVRCVLFLVLTFLSTAVLWILVNAEFLALILVLVYVGAVMTLFLFVVMMLNIDVESMKKHFIRSLPFGLIFVALLTTLLMVVIPSGLNVASSTELPPIGDTLSLGLVLYTTYGLPFELAAVLLLVAIIAAVTLAHRAPRFSKRQSIVKQIMTRRDDRVKLVKLKNEQ